MIVGVRENEQGAAAMTVSAARAKLIAFALAGFIAGLGGIALGAVYPTFGPAQRFFLVENSVAARVARGDRRARKPVGGGGRIALGDRAARVLAGQQARPALHVEHRAAHHLAVHPGGFVQIGYWIRDSFLRWFEQRLPPVDTEKIVTAPPVSLTRTVPPAGGGAQCRRQRARHRRG